MLAGFWVLASVLLGRAAKMLGDGPQDAAFFTFELRRKVKAHVAHGGVCAASLDRDRGVDAPWLRARRPQMTTPLRPRRAKTLRRARRLVSRPSRITATPCA